MKGATIGKVEKILKGAASHLVPNPFSPRTFGPPQLVPKNKQSRLIWSPWTNGPQDNWSPWTIGPQTFGPHGQMVPKKIGPPGQTVPKYLVPMDKWSPRQLVPEDNWSPKFISSFQKYYGTLFSIF